MGNKKKKIPDREHTDSKKETAKAVTVGASEKVTPKVVESIFKEPVSWLLAQCDHSHPKWGLCSMPKESLVKFFNEIAVLERRASWGDLLKEKGGNSSNTRNHSIDLNAICKEARNRAKERGIIELTSLRLTAKKRLYGFFEGNRFCILWYDQEHKICESHKRHT